MDNIFEEASSMVFAAPLANPAYFGFNRTTSREPYPQCSTSNLEMFSNGSDKSTPRAITFPFPPKATPFNLNCSDIRPSMLDRKSRKPSGSDSKYTGTKDPKESARKHQRKMADTPEAHAKRELSLEKNRMAANRCRKKKRNWTTKLEDTHRHLSAHGQLLRAEVASLNDAIIRLKEMTLQHANCGFQPIDEYLIYEADKVWVKAQRSLTGLTRAPLLPQQQQQVPPLESPLPAFYGSHMRMYDAVCVMWDPPTVTTSTGPGSDESPGLHSMLDPPKQGCTGQSHARHASVLLPKAL